MPVRIPDGDYYIFTASEIEYIDTLCMDVPIGNPDQSRGNNTPIQVYDHHGRENQLWRVTRVNGVAYTIVNHRSQLALDVPDARLDPVIIQQFHYFNGDADHPNQQWLFCFHQGVGGAASSPDVYSILNVNSGLALDLPNGDVRPGNWIQQYAAHNACDSPARLDNQAWALRRRFPDGTTSNIVLPL